MFRVQALPAELGKFDNRVSLAEEMRGLRGEELNKAAGLTDGEFVHASGFIGGAWSKESAIKMAELSMAKHNGSVANPDLEKKQKTE